MSEYTDKEQHQKDLQHVGNCVSNKGGTRKDKESWLRIKRRIADLEAAEINLRKLREYNHGLAEENDKLKAANRELVEALVVLLIDAIQDHADCGGMEDALRFYSNYTALIERHAGKTWGEIRGE
jgi:hypothetical protein